MPTKLLKMNKFTYEQFSNFIYSLMKERNITDHQYLIKREQF